jgi:hypothetical protein
MISLSVVHCSNGHAYGSANVAALSLIMMNHLECARRAPESGCGVILSRVEIELHSACASHTTSLGTYCACLYKVSRKSERETQRTWHNRSAAAFAAQQALTQSLISSSRR